MLQNEKNKKLRIAIFAGVLHIIVCTDVVFLMVEE
jgi:hypothetical protein